MTDRKPFGFASLMPKQIRDVLVVADRYEGFILEEDDAFHESLLAGLDFRSAPYLEHVDSGRAALKRLTESEREFKLVVATERCSDMAVEDLAHEIRQTAGNVPVAVLTEDEAEARRFAQFPRSSGIVQAFHWARDPRVLAGMIKSVEDLLNVDHDTRVGNVRVIILVEDSPSFYSFFLPHMYQALQRQVQELLPEQLSERQRHDRPRARPKILLVRNYEEAWEAFERYQDNLLGVITDISFPRGGEIDPQAGSDLIRNMRDKRWGLPDLPVLVQTHSADVVPASLRVEQVAKRDDDLVDRIRVFMEKYFGFGPFEFRTLDGALHETADDLKGMARALRKIPPASLDYHGRRHHISNWLMARSEFSIAQRLKNIRIEDFVDIEAVRSTVIEIFDDFLTRRQQGQVSEVGGRTRPLSRDYTRFGGGSLGGKARGLVFASQLLKESGIRERFAGIKIDVPRAAVVATDVFDRFSRRDDLRDRAREAETDQDVARLFLEAAPDSELEKFLAKITAQARYPLAVRSSSLHEDSKNKSSAGIYETYMLPNDSSQREVRLQQLSRAVRMVFASAFFRRTREFRQAHGLRLENEKLAVIVQKTFGRAHNGRFYPDFAGVAQSRNFYSQQQDDSTEGLVSVALGLGKTVVEGEPCFLFSPAQPVALSSLRTPRQIARWSQRHFWAIDLTRADRMPHFDSSDGLIRLDLEEAEADGTLGAVGATYSPEEDRITDSLLSRGHRIVNFAGVLKQGRFPLAELLRDLLQVAEEGLASPSEIEFAVVLSTQKRPSELSVLQMRPMKSSFSTSNGAHLERLGDTPALVQGRALGNGIYRNIRDVIYLHPKRFRPERSRLIAQEVARINRRLSKSERPYLLIGPGRWGTRDQWLGIPVAWNNVQGARIIVEVVPAGIEPSQGTHFFHNLTSSGAGYFCLDLSKADQAIDWEWLDGLELQEESEGLRHVSLEHPLPAAIDGQSGLGLIRQGDNKPAKNPRRSSP